jgi:hypothetical protein
MRGRTTETMAETSKQMEPSTPGFYYGEIVKQSTMGKAIINEVKENTGHNDPLELLNAEQLVRLKNGLNPLTGEKLKGVQDLVDSITKIYLDNEAKVNQNIWNIALAPSNIEVGEYSGSFLDKVKSFFKGAGSAVYNEVMAEETDAEKITRINKEVIMTELTAQLAALKGKWDSPFDDINYKGKGAYDFTSINKWGGSQSGYESNPQGGVIVTTGSKTIGVVEYEKAYESPEWEKYVYDIVKELAETFPGGVRYIVTAGGKTGYDILVEKAAAKLGIPIRKYVLTDEDWKKTKNAGKERDSAMIWDNIDSSYTTKGLSFFDNVTSPGASDVTKKMILSGINAKMINAPLDKTLTWLSTWGFDVAMAKTRSQKQYERRIKDEQIIEALHPTTFDLQKNLQFIRNQFGITKEPNYDDPSEDESDIDK